MPKSKLTDEEIQRYLLALQTYFYHALHLPCLPSHKQVYYLYKASESKRLWKDLGDCTGLDRTKIYKHYSFTYTRRFHPEISGQVYIDLNRIIDANGDVSAFEKEHNLHHDAVDQYIRYYKRKGTKTTPEGSPQKEDAPQNEGLQALLLAVLSDDSPLAGLLM